MNAEALPPRRLASDPNHADYRPDCMRVGVRINGEDRDDVLRYDVDAQTAETKTKHLACVLIEPYWRYAENRQQRRARERWEAGRK